MTDWYGGLAVAARGSSGSLPWFPISRRRPRPRPAQMRSCSARRATACPRWRHEAGESVCIPMSPQAMALGVDSLNVVAAAAVACYALMSGGD